MKKKIVVSRPVVFLLFLVALMIFIVRPALALVDASSSPPVDDSTTTISASTSMESIAADSASSTDVTIPTSTEVSTPAEQEAPATPTVPPPAGLKEVHIIGTKYIDYFTDGTSVTSYPGNPEIDADFAEADAPTPTHEGMKWVHTVGQPLYDTPSGDLEVGDYAVQSDGSYIENASFVSSTSTPAVSSPTVSTSAPAVLGASTSTTPADSDTFTPPGTWTATDTGSMVSPPPDAPESGSAASTAPATTTGS